jgi:outer membrane lipoprotein-sorting protein
MTRFTLALVAVLMFGSARAHAAALESTRALREGLAAHGRAEALLSWNVPGPPGSATQAMQGALALEPPGLARLDVRGNGEHITLRADGGEWLQPRLHQFIRLDARQSVAAMGWWRVLVGGGDVRERRLGARRWRLIVADTPMAAGDSADVSFDARGLPTRLELSDGMGGRQVYRLAAWRFTRPKGLAAFKLTPPPGVDVVEMP